MRRLDLRYSYNMLNLLKYIFLERQLIYSKGFKNNNDNND